MIIVVIYLKTYLLFILAILPVIILLKYTFDKDKIEKESLVLLLTLFISGIIASLLTIVVSNTINMFTSFDQILFHSFIKVALLEEVLKWIFVYAITWKNKEFNYLYDAIVYSIFVSLGFACFENIIYAFQYGFLTSILRAIISVPSHAFFCVYMGYYLGNAKFKSLKNEKCSIDIFKSILIPTLLHGMYDFCLLNGKLLFYLLFIVFIVLLYFFSLRKIDKVSDINISFKNK